MGRDRSSLREVPAAGLNPPPSYLPALAGVNFGIYVVLLTPVLVSMAFKLQHLSPTGDAARQSLGLVLALGALVALIVNPLVGRLSDRTTSRLGRRRPWILGGVLVGLLGSIVIGLASAVWVVLVAWCVVQASMNAVLAAANATIADQVPTTQRGKVSGVVGIALPTGIIAGSLLVAVLAADLARFLVPALLAVVLAVIFVVVLRDPALRQPPAEPLTLRRFLASFVFDPRTHRDFGWTWLTKFLINFGYGGVATYLPFYLTERFALPEQQAVNTLLAANLASMGMLAISSPIAGVISDRVGARRPFVAVAGAIIVVGLVMLALAPNVAMIIVAQAIIGLGGGSFFSVDLALATQVLPSAADTAKDLGVLNIANTLPQSLAPAMAPTIIGLGAGTALGGYTTWFLFGAVVSLAGAVLVYRIRGVR